MGRRWRGPEDRAAQLPWNGYWRAAFALSEAHAAAGIAYLVRAAAVAARDVRDDRNDDNDRARTSCHRIDAIRRVQSSQIMILPGCEGAFMVSLGVG